MDLLNNKNIIAAVIASFTIFGFFAFVLPGYDGINAARSTLNDRKDLLAERTALVNQLAVLSSQYNQNAANINKLDVLLPTNEQQDQVVSAMQDISSQSGLVLSEMGIADIFHQQSDTPYKSSLVTVQLAGQYEQFFGFMRLLEQSLRLYDIQAINIGQSNTSNGSSAGKQLNFEVKINVNSIK